MADQRQPVRPALLQRVRDADFQVVQKIRLGVRLVGVAARRLQDAHVAGFLDVLAGRQDQPQVVVVEVTADLGVALLRKRLVLVIASAVG